MAKFGSTKRTVHEIAAQEQVAHDHVPGSAYEISDPVTKLIHTIGGGFFNEPKYYDSNRTAAEFYRELLTTGRISSTILDEDGLTEQAREVLETAIAVANGDTPEDLLIIAAWARDTANGLKLRSTPQVLFALAAAHPNTKQFVPKYATRIMRRADEIRQVFGAYRHLFMSVEGASAGNRPHRGALPHALRKALALALASQDDAYLLKYNGKDSPTFSDVLLMVGGSKKIGRFLERSTGEQRDNWPVSKAMFEYLVNGRYIDELPPVLAARKAFYEASDSGAITLDLVDAAGLTWENVVSHLGSNKAVWELCIPVMGEMALTRNLRNFEQAEISDEAWGLVFKQLESVEKSVQLPFRFFAADRQVSSTQAKSVLGAMLERSVASVANLPGVTMVLTDNSGSAVGATISGRSNIRVSDCGNMLAAIIAKRSGRRAIVGVFGDSSMWVPYSDVDSCMTIKNQIDAVAQTEERSDNGALAIPTHTSGEGVGMGTETGLWFAINDLTERKVHVDRMILLSDLCCYTQGDNGTAQNCGVNMEEYFGKGATMQSMIDRYRHTVNSDCYVYSINLNGHQQSQLRPEGGRTHLLSGWSEKLLDLIVDIESGKSDGAETNLNDLADPANPQQEGATEAADIPVVELLRSRYQAS